MCFLLRNALFWMALFATMMLPAVTVNVNLAIDIDGALHGSLEYVIPDKAAGLLKGFFHELSLGDNNGPLDEAAVRRHFSQSDVITLDSYHVYTIPNGRRIRLEFSAPDAQKAFSSGFLGNISLGDVPDLGRKDFTASFPKHTIDWTPQRAAFARKLLEAIDGLDLVLRLQTPTPLLVHDKIGIADSANLCHWNLDLGDLMHISIPIFHASF